MSGLLSLARRAGVARRLAARPDGAFGLTIVTLLITCAIFAPGIAPYGAAKQDLNRRLESPSLHHPLGTDDLGRDVLSRIVEGTRIALGVAVPAVLGGLLFGLALGLAGGYFGGFVDSIAIMVMDTLQAFPFLVLALALIAMVGSSLRNVIIVLAVAFAPGYARISRALVIGMKQHPCIEAERALGASARRIVGVHILPNIIPALIVLIALDIPAAIAAEAALSFLGLGVPPPTPSWGVILADGFARVREAPWPVISVGFTLMLVTLGLTALAEAVRDILDPRVVDAVKIRLRPRNY